MPTIATAPKVFAHEKNYVPELDGLRAISILLVIFGHFGFAMFPGIFGVTIFFFISGYLITGQLLQELDRSGGIAFGSFYMRRALRLYPALVVAVVLGGGAFALAGGKLTSLDVMSALLYFANYHDFFGGNDSGLLQAGHPFGVLWSLAVEEHYYLFFPPLVLLFARNRLRFAVMIVIAILAVTAWRLEATALCHSGVMTCDGPGRLRIEHGTDTRADSILYGSLLAILVASTAKRRLFGLLHSRMVFLFGILLLVMSLLIRDEWFRHTIRFTLQGIGLLLCTGGLLFSDWSTPMRRIVSSRPLIIVGRLSYSLYLWHWMVFVLAGVLLPERLWEPVMHPGVPPLYWCVTVLPVLLCLSFVTALISYNCIESPMLALRRRFGSQTVAVNLIGSTQHETMVIVASNQNA